MEDAATYAGWWLIPSMAGGCALVILSGARAVHYGSLLGARLGLSSLWVGLVILAALTSLPELVVTIAAQTAVGRPGLVMSNVAGSNMFNLMIFPLLDLLEGPGAVSVALSPRLVQPALMGVGIMAVVVLGFVLPWFLPEGSHFWVGWITSLAVVGTYIFAMRRFTGGDDAEEEDEEAKGLSLRQIVLRFSCYSILLVGSGTTLIFLCDYLILHPIRIGSFVLQVQENLVGTAVLGIVTSLPELTVCLTTLRMRAFDMAIGNILGSNIFNCTLLAVGHVIRPLDAFWSQAGGIHVFSLSMAMLLSLIVATGIRSKSRFSLLRMGWDGLLLVLLGIITFIVIGSYGVSVG